MTIVNDRKLEAVAKFIGETEVEGNCICDNFNEVLEENKINVPCTASNCKSNCPFYSKENFIKWIKKPDSKYDVSNLKRPQQEDFVGYDNRSNSLLDKDGYIKALEEYCDNLGDALADAEYDFEEVECENRALLKKLEKIRGVLDGSH